MDTRSLTYSNFISTLKGIFLMILIFGATEKSFSQTIIYVDKSAVGADDGTSWANAYKNLQTAIDAAALIGNASSSAQVWVKEGTYYPTKGTDRTISFVMKNFVELFGGFNGTESAIAQRNWLANATILSGEIGDNTTLGDNTHSVINNEYTSGSPLGRSAVIDGFTITGGYMALASRKGGGGMRNVNASPTIRNMVFDTNNATFSSSSVGPTGGAIFNQGESHPYIESCKFYKNYGRSSGGAISFGEHYYNTGSPNTAHSVESVIVNCLFDENLTQTYGSALFINNYYVNLYNNTFTENAHTQPGSFIYGRPIFFIFDKPNTNSSMINNILFNNKENGVWLQIQNSVSVSVVQTNTLTADPGFNDAANNDYTLDACNSVATNAGSALPITIASDLGGNPRIADGAIDIGAFEAQGAPPSFSTINVENATCYGANDGQILVSGGGSFGPITFSIDGTNYSSTTLFNALSPGTYTLYAKDANGCVVTETRSITEPTAINISLTNVVNATCFGGTGTVSGTISGGLGPYRISQDGISYGASQFTSQFSLSGYAAGSNQKVFVKDASNCVMESSVFTITEPTQMTASVTAMDISCFGANDGSIDFTSSGGTLPWSWSTDGSNFQTTPITSLAADNYTVTFKDANGCQITRQATISEPSLLQLSSNGAVDATCPGAGDGSLSVNASGGTGTYEYSIDGTNFQSSASFSALTKGDYTVTVKDANGCTATVNETVGGPTAFVITQTITNVTCFGGTNGEAGFSVTGGTTPYTYSLDGTTFQSASTFADLPAASYTFTVKDAAGCLGTVTFNVTQPAQLAVTSQPSAISCKGANDGQVMVSASGGTEPYTYSIDGSTFASTATFTGLTAGDATVTVKDANGCTAVQTVTVVEPSALMITDLAVGEVKCNGQATGSLTVTATGGTTPYQYSINGADFQAENEFTTLSAGSYTVTAKDAQACTTTFEATISEPAKLTLAATTTTPSCAGVADGKIALEASGGTSPYLFSFDGGDFSDSGIFSALGVGEYVLLVKDAKECQTSLTVSLVAPSVFTIDTDITNASCVASEDGSITVGVTGSDSDSYTYSLNGSDFQDAASFSGLLAGAYTVVTRNQNGCTATVEATVSAPAAISISTTLSPTSCGLNNGSVVVDATGGTGTLSFKIDESDFGTLTTFGQLAAGEHIVSVMDEAGCSTSTTVQVEASSPISLSLLEENGEVTASVTGGTAPYTYSSNGTDFQESNIFSLTPGDYTITTKDANGCLASAEVVITIETGIADELLKQGLTVYPNPAHNTIAFNAATLKAVRLYDLSGNEVLTVKNYRTRESIDLSTLVPGVVIVELELSTGERMKQRLIIER